MIKNSLKTLNLLAITLSFLLGTDVFASDETYCLKNEAGGTFYVYNKDGRQLGAVGGTKHFPNFIQKTDFPLTISTCPNGISDCGNKLKEPVCCVNNHRINKPACYTIEYMGGFGSPRVACDICRKL